jgi:hypothetical protein
MHLCLYTSQRQQRGVPSQDDGIVCDAATAPLIEHLDERCVKYLSDANSCLNVIVTVDVELDFSKEKDAGGEI